MCGVRFWSLDLKEVRHETVQRRVEEDTGTAHGRSEVPLPDRQARGADCPEQGRHSERGRREPLLRLRLVLATSLTGTRVQRGENVVYPSRVSRSMPFSEC